MGTVPSGFYLMMGLVVLLVGVVLALLPRLTRPEIYFSVTVPADFRDTDEGRAVAQRFQWGALVVTVAAAALVALAATRDLPSLAGLVVVGQILGILPWFLAARRRTRTVAAVSSTVREAVLTPRVRQTPAGMLLHAAPFVLITAAASMIALRWSSLPGRVPVHWGLDGQADGWVPRTPGTVTVMLASLTLVCAVLAILSWAVGTRVRRIRLDPRGSAAETRFRRLVQTAILVGLYLTAMPAVLLALLTIGIESRSPLLWAGPMAVLLGAVALLTWRGQGGARRAGPAADEQAAPAAPVGDRTADACWKLGLIYVNRDDPAFIVEKRFGIGYTLNFGNPWSWVLLTVVVIIAVAFGIAPSHG